MKVNDAPLGEADNKAAPLSKSFQPPAASSAPGEALWWFEASTGRWVLGEALEGAEVYWSGRLWRSRAGWLELLGTANLAELRSVVSPPVGEVFCPSRGAWGWSVERGGYARVGEGSPGALLVGPDAESAQCGM